METNNDFLNLYVYKVFSDTPLSCVRCGPRSIYTVPNVRIPEAGEKAEGVRKLRHQQVGGEAAI